MMGELLSGRAPVARGVPTGGLDSEAPAGRGASQPGYPGGVLVVGDAQQRVVFVDTGAGAVLESVALQYGQLTSQPLQWGTLALFGEGAAVQGASALHAFDLAASPVADIWDPGIQVSGSVDATPVIAGDTMWVASDTGYLFGVNISNVRAPRPQPPVNVLRLPPGQTAKITGLLPTGDGKRLLLVTQSGVYGVDVTPRTPVVRWTSLPSVDLTGLPAALQGDLLLVASGSTVYALAAYPASGSPAPVWTYPADFPVTRILALGTRFVLLLGDGGSAAVLDNSDATSRARFSLLWPQGAAAWASFCGDALVALSPGGHLAADTLPVSTAGTISPAQVWRTQPGPASFAGPPATTDGLVFAVGGDGTLHALDLGAKSTVFSVTLASAPLSHAVISFAPAVRGSATASVRFLLDGEAFFPTMRDLMIATAQQSFTKQPSLSKNLKFSDLIRQLSDAAVDTYVMMWDMSLVLELAGNIGNWTTRQLAETLGAPVYESLFTPGGAIKSDLRFNSQTYLALQGIPHVHAYLEPYYSKAEAWFARLVEFGSNHQKIAIFSVNGTKLALVSGFNILSGYYDEDTHPDRRSWHDTGLLLQGEAVNLVEAEFDRRWSKQGAPPAPQSASYAKIAAWMIAPGTCIDTPAVCSGFIQPSDYKDRRLTSPAVPAQIAITSNERSTISLNINKAALLTGVHQIRDQLISAIGASSSYVYLENYGIHDVGLVQALAARLQAAPPGFVAILNVPYPTVGEARAEFSLNSGENYLNRWAYAALTLSSADWATVATKSGETFTAADGATVLFDSRGIEYTQVMLGGAVPLTVNVRDVATIMPGTQPRTLLYSSAARYFNNPPQDGRTLNGQRPNFRGVYVHSKLALFDDAQALVGSANFTRRSMLQDGELSVLMHDKVTATAIRRALFGHWNMTTPANWEADMTRFAATTTESLGILPLPLSALPNFQPTWPWYLATQLLFDPSQLL
jgi:phosphatidylserine/phosphatidylglycerophosphate/cardiolipin synthase-like enzyme